MNLVLGFIDTPEGWAAARYAIAESKLRDARVVVVNSMRGGESEDDYIAIRSAVDTLKNELESEDVAYEVHEFARGLSPTEDLLAAARDYDAELVIIGIRRRSKTGKVLLGSHALEILHDADVPVICVKAVEQD